MEWWVIPLVSQYSNIDDLVKSLFKRHPGESRGPDVVPTKVGNHFKDWIPVFIGNPGFRSETRLYELPPE